MAFPFKKSGGKKKIGKKTGKKNPFAKKGGSARDQADALRSMGSGSGGY